MTALILAHKHCSNFSDGQCAGVDFRKNGSLFRFRKEGERCLLKDGRRCSFFETAVLPIRSRKEWPDEEVRKGFLVGAAQYDRDFIHDAPQTRIKRKCIRCGRTMWSAMQLCTHCRVIDPEI